MRFNVHSYPLPPQRHQRGFALLAVLAFCSLWLGLALWPQWGSTTSVAQRFQALQQARQALLAWSISQTDPAFPGKLPLPDINFSGNAERTHCLSDSKHSAAIHTRSRCLGHLPWRDLGINQHHFVSHDGLGHVIWYAVSANLVDTRCAIRFNPRLASLPINTDRCGDPRFLAHPWITLHDVAGNIIAERVAILLIYPGKAQSQQQRAYRPARINYHYIRSHLGDFNAKHHHHYQLPSKDSAWLFVSIDELIRAVETRVLNEVQAVLAQYYQRYHYYPWAAPLGYQQHGIALSRHVDTLHGSLPLPLVHLSQGHYLDAVFGANRFVRFESSTPQAYLNASGYCQVDSNSCQCTGAGYCHYQREQYDYCDDIGGCIAHANMRGRLRFVVPASPLETIQQHTGQCHWHNPQQIECALNHQQAQGSGSRYLADTASIPPLSSGRAFPLWFHRHGWRHFIYYAIAANCSPKYRDCSGQDGYLPWGKLSLKLLLLISKHPLQPHYCSLQQRCHIPAQSSARWLTAMK